MTQFNEPLTVSEAIHARRSVRSYATPRLDRVPSTKLLSAAARAPTVGTMERRFGKANRVWVMDRGMVSAENIAWLNTTGRRYVIGTARAELRRWSKELADKNDWRQIREDLQVKICRGPEGNETFLLCC